MPKKLPISRLPFTVNHYICPPECSFTDFLDVVTQHGFSGIGLTERALTEMPVSQVRRELSARDLGISSINTAGFFLKEGRELESQNRRNQELLEWSVKLGRSGLNLIVGGTDRLTPAQARQQVLDALSPFVAEAERLGVPLMLEPLHPMRIRDKSCINTLAHYHQLKRLFPSLILSADLFHLWWDPDLDRVLADPAETVGVLQICDVAEQGGEVRRVPLSEGFVDWQAHVRTVQQFLPAVPIELELFADQLVGRSMTDLLAESAKKLAELDAD